MIVSDVEAHSVQVKLCNGVSSNMMFCLTCLGHDERCKAGQSSDTHEFDLCICTGVQSELS